MQWWINQLGFSLIKLIFFNAEINTEETSREKTQHSIIKNRTLSKKMTMNEKINDIAQQA